MKAAFVFAGQGAQSAGMGKSLYDNSPAARKIFEEADTILGWSVSDVCFNGPDEKLTESGFCQPAIYTVSLACLAGFRERFPDIKPCAVAGLSLGEYSALACAGAFSFAEGLRLVARRGELMDIACKETVGGMASVLGMDPDVIAEVCRQFDIDIANYNCPGQIVISGPKDRVTEAGAVLKEKGARRVVPLNVAGAFHSRLMASAGNALTAVLKDVKITEPSVPAAQNFVGSFVRDPEEIRMNLQRQVAGSVRLESCIRAIKAQYEADTVIEFGPGTVVSGLARKTDASFVTKSIASMDDIEKFL